MSIILENTVKPDFFARQGGISGERQAESEYHFEKTKPILGRSK
jgi:hypothetical protein